MLTYEPRYSGAFAGGLSSFVMTPIELVKCNMQIALNIPAERKALTIRSVITLVYKHGGLRRFWYGQTGTFVREVGGGALWFGFKETTTEFFYRWNVRRSSSEGEKKILREVPLPLWQQGLAGASAGVSYNFFFFPADTIKSRMQTSALLMKGKTKTFQSETKEVWSQLGLRGLYQGCGITLLKSVPASAFIFVVHDSLMQLLQPN